MNQLTSVKTNQSGIGLLEAMIGVALSAIIILGAVYSTSRMMVSQKNNNLHYIVVNALSGKLQAATAEQKESWCDGDETPTITLPGAATTTDITVHCATVQLKVTGNTTNPTYNTTFTEQQPMVFEVLVPELGGKVTVGEVLE